MTGRTLKRAEQVDGALAPALTVWDRRVLNAVPVSPEWLRHEPQPSGVGAEPGRAPRYRRTEGDAMTEVKRASGSTGGVVEGAGAEGMGIDRQTQPDQPKRPTLLEAIGGVQAELYAEACDHVNHHEAQRRLAEAEVVRLRAEVERLRGLLMEVALTPDGSNPDRLARVESALPADEDQQRHACRCPCGHEWTESRDDPQHAECPVCTGDNFTITTLPSREEGRSHPSASGSSEHAPSLRPEAALNPSEADR